MSPQISKANKGVLEMRRDGETNYTTIATAMRREQVEFSDVPRVNQFTTVKGRVGVESQGISDPVVTTVVADNTATATLFGWFYYNGTQFDLRWSPNGRASGETEYTVSGDVTIGGNFAASRTRPLTLRGNVAVASATISG